MENKSAAMYVQYRWLRALGRCMETKNWRITDESGLSHHPVPSEAVMYRTAPFHAVPGESGLL